MNDNMYAEDFHDEIIRFIRNFFSGAFKDNKNLSYGFLTGILHITGKSGVPVSLDKDEYLYKILAFARHTKTGEKLVIYQGLYAPFKVCARLFAMFMSEVDREKYPDIRQKYRFEKIGRN